MVRRLCTSHSGPKDSLYPGKPRLQESGPLVDSCLAVLRMVKGSVLVQLEEAQLRMDLEDRPLPIRFNVLVHFGETAGESATDRTQTDVDTFGQVPKH